MKKLLKAVWPAAEHVNAGSTFRELPDPFDKTNPMHYEKLATSLPYQPQWLNQTHSNQVLIIEEGNDRNADAAITRQPNTILAILTADCLPIVLTNQAGTEIAAIHAGWRGLAQGIIENTLSKMNTPATDCIAWIGPAICGQCFVVKKDVKQVYQLRYPESTVFFQKKEADSWLLDLPALAKAILTEHHIPSVSLSKACTFEEEALYYSYRRTGDTGRIATFIWFNHRN